MTFLAVGLLCSLSYCYGVVIGYDKNIKDIEEAKKFVDSILGRKTT